MLRQADPQPTANEFGPLMLPYVWDIFHYGSQMSALKMLQQRDRAQFQSQPLLNESMEKVIHRNFSTINSSLRHAVD